MHKCLKTVKKYEGVCKKYGKAYNIIMQKCMKKV